MPRLPGHGTAPGALTDVDWENWLAASRLAVREAAPDADDLPLHLVGYSNGGALAMKYALDALDAPELRKPQQIVLLSPMIGVTAFALCRIRRATGHVTGVCQNRVAQCSPE